MNIPLRQIPVIGEQTVSRPSLDTKCPFCEDKRHINDWGKETGTCGKRLCMNKLSVETSRKTREKRKNYWYEK